MKQRKKRLWRLLALIVSGIGIGAMNGLLGGGGGMIAVPALSTAGGLDAKKAHATAIAVMLPLCIISAVTYTLGGVYRWHLGAVCGGAVSAGGVLGAALLGRLDKSALSIAFYGLMIVAGIQSLVRWFG